MQKEISLLSAAIFIASILLLSACAKERDKTLTITGNVKIDRGSTEDGINFFSTPLEDFFLSPLVAIDIATNKYQKILVKEVISLEGGRVWDIRLKDNVRFHDGTPLTANDVVFSIEKRKEMAPSLGAIRQAEATDRMTVRLRLDNPLSDISDMLSLIFVYPSHILTQEEYWRKIFLKNPIGSGPFKFERWLERGMVFVANKEYFEGRPHIDRISYISEGDEKRRVTYLLKGEADVALPVSPYTAHFIRKDPRFYLNEFPLPSYSALFLNTRSQILSDSLVRKAVNMAVNKGSLIDKGLQVAALPVTSPFTADMLPENYSETPYGYDPKMAAALLKEAGWRDKDGDGVLEKNGTRLRVRLLYSSASEEFKRVAVIIAQQLYEIGIEVQSGPVDYTAFAGKGLLSLKYDALLDSKGVFNPESTWKSRSLYGSNTFNYSDYSNKEVDDLFEQAKKTTDTNEVKRIYARIDRTIHEDAPAVFLYAPAYCTAANRRFKGAKGHIGTPLDTYKIKDWDLER